MNTTTKKISIALAIELVKLKWHKKKMDAEPFNRLTNWKGKTNEHARDAEMLVFGL